MNRTKRLLFSMLTLLCCCTGAWALDLDSSDGYYKIGSLQDWKDFATLVQTTPTVNAKMTADVDLGNDQTMIGSSSTPYQGTFDGKNYTLTINYTVSAPFRYISNATIKNIHVAGTIDSSTSQSAPIGICKGSCTVENLWSSLTVTASTSGWQEAAGIVGLVDYSSNLTMRDCLFSGKITTSSAYNGCFVGYIHDNGSATITNCLSVGTFSYSGVGSGFRGTHTNCYVKQFPVASFPNGVTKATDETLADGSIAYKLQADREDLVWGQLIGTDSQPVQTNDESYRVYRSKNGGYTNDPTLSYDGIQQDTADGYYLVGSLADWWEFAEIVETTQTANAKMTADIDLGDNQKVVAYSSIYFKGIFDGQGHTITVNLTSTKNNYGLFCNIYGATIKNLRVTGTINTLTYSSTGGIVGLSFQTCTITNCRSSVTLNASLGGQGHHGGLVGYLSGTLNISDCIFDGVFEGKNTSGWGGLVGYKYNGAVNINNCLFNPASLKCDKDYSATFSGNGGTVSNSCFYTQTLDGYQSITQGKPATAEELANGTITTALQAKRSEEVWVQDPLTNQPMLKTFATAAYTVPSSGIGTFSAKAKFAVPDGLTAYYCQTYDEKKSTISVVAVDGAVPANTGVVLRGTAGETYTLTGTNSEAATITDNALVAVTEATHVEPVSGEYTNFMMSGGKFILIENSEDDVKMPANRAYLRILTELVPPNTAWARSIMLDWDDDATGIQVVRDSRPAVDGYYNLAGQRVAHPTKGLYIVGGRKVVIK